jgi:hypothetical protein
MPCTLLIPGLVQFEVGLLCIAILHLVDNLILIRSFSSWILTSLATTHARVIQFSTKYNLHCDSLCGLDTPCQQQQLSAGYDSQITFIVRSTSKHQLRAREQRIPRWEIS